MSACSQPETNTYRPFVYGLVDPDDIGHIRYVGMAPSRATRPYDHSKFARKATTKDTHQIRWIRKIQAEGRDYLVTILEESPCGTPREILGGRETPWILTLREYGHRLTNENDGGWGGSNGPHTLESRQKMRDGWTPEVRARVGKAASEQPRVPRSIESRAQQSANSRGHKKSDVTRKRMAEARLKAWAEGKYDSPEYRKSISDAMAGRGHPQTQETRDAISNTLSGREHSPSHRANNAAAQRGKVQSLETRAKRSAAIKAAWERRKAAGYTVSPETCDAISKGKIRSQIRKLEAKLRQLEAEMAQPVTPQLEEIAS